MDILHLFLRRRFVRKPVVELQNVGCFLRLLYLKFDIIIVISKLCCHKELSFGHFVLTEIYFNFFFSVLCTEWEKKNAKSLNWTTSNFLCGICTRALYLIVRVLSVHTIKPYFPDREIFVNMHSWMFSTCDDNNYLSHFKEVKLK